MFKRFNLSTFHWASLFVSGGALALNVLTRSFPKFSSVSSSSKLVDAILFFFVVSRWLGVMDGSLDFCHERGHGSTCQNLDSLDRTWKRKEKKTKEKKTQEKRNKLLKVIGQIKPIEEANYPLWGASNPKTLENKNSFPQNNSYLHIPRTSLSGYETIRFIY